MQARSRRRRAGRPRAGRCRAGRCRIARSRATRDGVVRGRAVRARQRDPVHSNGPHRAMARGSSSGASAVTIRAEPSIRGESSRLLSSAPSGLTFSRWIGTSEVPSTLPHLAPSTPATSTAKRLDRVRVTRHRCRRPPTMVPASNRTVAVTRRSRWVGSKPIGRSTRRRRRSSPRSAGARPGWRAPIARGAAAGSSTRARGRANEGAGERVHERRSSTTKRLRRAPEPRRAASTGRRSGDGLRAEAARRARSKCCERRRRSLRRRRSVQG